MLYIDTVTFSRNVNKMLYIDTVTDSRNETETSEQTDSQLSGRTSPVVCPQFTGRKCTSNSCLANWL